MRTRVSLCKKQNDVRVLNDVVCLTICVGIYEQQEREREKEKTNFYILYIYIAMQYNAFSELNEFYRVLISFQIEWMDGKTQTKKNKGQIMRLPFLLFAFDGGESCVCEESVYSALSWRQPKWHWVLRCGQKVGGETFDSIL